MPAGRSGRCRPGCVVGRARRGAPGTVGGNLETQRWKPTLETQKNPFTLEVWRATAPRIRSVPGRNQSRGGLGGRGLSEPPIASLSINCPKSRHCVAANVRAPAALDQRSRSALRAFRAGFGGVLFRGLAARPRFILCVQVVGNGLKCRHPAPPRSLPNAPCLDANLPPSPASARSQTMRASSG